MSKASLRTNKQGIFIMIASSLVTSVGQATWKLANGDNINYLLIGLLCYFIGAILMIVALRFGSLSILHPLLSTGYIFSIFIGFFWLDEIINVKMIFGIMLISIGAICIGGDND